MSKRSLVPSAHRLMSSLRDLGYELPQAIAELVDNSIDAGATEVAIDFCFAGRDSFIRVADNGRGMTARGLDEAMRYGSGARYAEGSLGGFGLGLKTASLSQCRRLYVASRRTMRMRPEARLWDLDEVERLDDWVLERLTPGESPSELLAPLERRPGCVVLWEALDRVAAFRSPSGLRAEAAMRTLALDTGRHLAMVFHRFLSGEARRGRPLRIVIDGDDVAPWDPFSRDEPATQVLPAQTLLVRSGRTDHEVIVRPYLLPSQQRFSSPDAHLLAAGPARWNRQQGLYVYREDRLVQSGGWNRLRTQDEHTKLARIALEFPRRLDETFRVNVSKMRVSLPEAIRPEMRALVGAVATLAQERYRSHRAPAQGDPGGALGPPPSATGPAVTWSDVSRHDLIPRARAVQVLRTQLRDEPALLRRLVDAIVNDDWSPDALTAGNGQLGTVPVNGAPVN